MRVTFKTTCSWCGAVVYYHSNGNGDHVFFDALTGAPWPVHECWELHARPRTRAQRERLALLRQLAVVREIASGSRPVVVERVPGESAVDRALRESEVRRQATRDYVRLSKELRRKRKT